MASNAAPASPEHTGVPPDTEKKAKTAKELIKEQAKAEKLRKFQQKQQKQANAAPTASAKEKKATVEVAGYTEATPTGQKKILKPLDDAYCKAYIPKVVESAWYEWWEQQGYFKPEFDQDGNVKKEGYFVIPVPPPNVTGALHLGHALASSIQDALVRYHRMQGMTVLYLPGCDHAGISTQSVVENMLWRREGKTRHDVGRVALINQIWKWKEDYHNRINTVLRRMGGSFDWTREAFTMDANLSRAVTETFCRLHDEGLIYRENRLVNWCTRLQTALSNLEVDNRELAGRTLIDVPGYDRKVEFGVLTTFKYQINGTEGEYIAVATTRPETILGDTGIAVHPDDPRYKHLVGKHAKHPFLDRLLPIVADTYVEMDFGTGAVKITPAHDPNDFAIGKRHKLENINIFTDDGLLNANAGEFEGQRRFDARYDVVAKLKELNLYIETKENPMIIPLCSKTKDVIEPILKPQWWMRMDEMAKAALDAVEDGRIKIRPDRASRSYKRWLENIEPWCLSRQLWWGHQCPAYCIYMDGTNTEEWVTGRTEEEAFKKAEAKFPGKNITLARDPDVLDTWFSSGLWPFSTLGWPNKTHDLENLFPTSLLETGWDILFFWVARMVMLSLKLTGKIPFSEVYCHSLVRDTFGRKMSKSLGNVIDPIDVMEGITLEQLNAKLYKGNLDPKEVAKATQFQQDAFPQGIPECGADALRFSLIQYTASGEDINFDIKVMHAYRRFCNKIYQATKYVLGTFDKHGKDFVPSETATLSGNESLPERWIISKFNNAVKGVNEAMRARELSHATRIIYSYLYDELCDIFIENSKAIISDGSSEQRASAMNTLYTAIEGGLRLIHPFMPFLSEELWQRLPRRPTEKTNSIMFAMYPQYEESLHDIESEDAYELVLGCAKGVRSLLAEYKINRPTVTVFIQTTNFTLYERVTSQLQAIKSISGKNASSIEVLGHDKATPTGCAVYVVSSSAVVFLKLQGNIDVNEEISKVRNKLEKVIDGVTKQRQLIDSPEFQEKVNGAVQEEATKKLQELLGLQHNYERTVQQFQNLRAGSE
ncbi:valyl-tRNA synthetase [Glonium stellatum]|uniref:Valine--tRNA ligase, mitochondrial n=1 Tax=Glonium stellatum TaxID=574774 RepID=A0A8E2F496_9PEZI|nr:valyl-tRNA synthetase [Glonium stellatum]